MSRSIPVRILNLFTIMNRGGAERVISILSNHYIKKNYSVSIAMLLNNKIMYNLPSQVSVVDLSSNSRFGIKKDFINYKIFFKNSPV